MVEQRLALGNTSQKVNGPNPTRGFSALQTMGRLG